MHPQNTASGMKFPPIESRGKEFELTFRYQKQSHPNSDDRELFGEFLL
jgi:hypothetical protein